MPVATADYLAGRLWNPPGDMRLPCRRGWLRCGSCRQVMLCPANELPTNDLRSKCAGEISRLVNKGCLFDKAKEKEANFLAAELLVPYEAALKAAFGEKTNDEIAVAYGVSTPFAQMRMAGARKHAARALAKQARSKHEASTKQAPW